MIIFEVYFSGAVRAQNVAINSSEDSSRPRIQQKISGWVTEVSEAIDVFLAGRRLTHLENESQLHLFLWSAVHRQGEHETNFDVGYDLHLPNVEEYWKLKFTSYDESEETGIKKVEPRTKSKPKNYGASISFAKKLKDIRTSYEPRVEFTYPFQISHYLEFESVAESEKIRINPKIQFFARHSRGAGFGQALNFNYTISDIWSVTLSNQGEYFSVENSYEVRHGLSFSQILTEISSLSYGISTFFFNRPEYRLNSFSLWTSYSKDLKSDFVHFSISPSISFLRDTDFTGDPALTAQLKFIF